MFKYYMIIDGSRYNALFLDHFEAADFLDANERDGSEVIIDRIEEVSPVGVLADPDFDDAYSIEMVAAYLMPARRFEKWTHAEQALRSEFPILFW